MMKEVYTIGIKLKPYAQLYMTKWYGNPVNLYNSDQKDLLNKIIDCLEKPKRDRDKECKMNGYIETRFVISQHEFYRVGVMTKTDMVRINRRIEDSIKAKSRNYIFQLTGIGTPINEAIRQFQERINLPEEYMSYTLIYKDYLRYRKYLKPYPIAELYIELKKVVTDLAESRQIL